MPPLHGRVSLAPNPSVDAGVIVLILLVSIPFFGWVGRTLAVKKKKQAKDQSDPPPTGGSVFFNARSLSADAGRPKRFPTRPLHR
jgi:hypothetical protein